VLLDPLFYVLAVPAVLVMGISKAGFGGGVGSLAVPVMALAVPVPQAAAITLPLLCIMDLISVWAYRKTWDPGNLRIIMPGIIVGTLLGWASFRYFDEHMIRALIGGIGVGFAIVNLMPFMARLPAAGRSVVKGGFWSAVAGFTSFIAHAGGPPLAVYMLPQRLHKSLFVGTVVIAFTLANYAKVLPYFLLGQFSTQNLWSSVLLAPLAPIGILIGLWLHKRVPPEGFYRWCNILLLLTGSKLIVDGVSGLL